MNNSVFSRLNFIDAIIILTSAKLIFRPIFPNISIKLPNPLTIKQYDFNHLLKLKPRKQNLKPKPDPIYLDLPDDILLTILSKVDIVTLRRCTLALSLDDILPRIVSFSTPLHASLFLPDKSRCWYGRLFNKIISNSVVLFLMCLGSSNSVIPETVIKLTADVFLWINMPVLKPQAVDFFKKLTGLRSLEIELPTTMPCYDCRVSPHLWFKWDARFGVYDNVASYGVYVFGDKVDVSEGYAFKRLSLILRATKTVAYHTMLHCSLMDLGFEGGMRITTKDAGRNAGSMMMGPQSGWDSDKARFKILHLPSTLKFNCYANDEEEDAVQVQDVVLMFLVFVDDASDDRDDNDIIMACLADMDGEEEEAANQRIELRQIVAEIITDENCKVILDSH